MDGQSNTNVAEPNFQYPQTIIPFANRIYNHLRSMSTQHVQRSVLARKLGTQVLFPGRCMHFIPEKQLALGLSQHKAMCERFGLRGCHVSTPTSPNQGESGVAALLNFPPFYHLPEAEAHGVSLCRTPKPKRAPSNNRRPLIERTGTIAQNPRHSQNSWRC